VKFHRPTLPRRRAKRWVPLSCRERFHQALVKLFGQECNDPLGATFIAEYH